MLENSHGPHNDMCFFVNDEPYIQWWVPKIISPGDITTTVTHFLSSSTWLYIKIYSEGTVNEIF